MVDEVDGVVDSHTEHHRNQGGSHHIQRDASPAHEAAHEDGWHEVRDETYQADAHALEGYHQDDGDDEHRDEERLHLTTHQILHHGGVLRDVILHSVLPLTGEGQT